MNIQDYSRMGKEDRKKFYKQIKKQAYPRYKRKADSPEEIARKLKAWQTKK